MLSIRNFRCSLAFVSGSDEKRDYCLLSKKFPSSRMAFGVFRSRFRRPAALVRFGRHCSPARDIRIAVSSRAIQGASFGSRRPDLEAGWMASGRCSAIWSLRSVNRPVDHCDLFAGHFHNRNDVNRCCVRSEVFGKSFSNFMQTAWQSKLCKTLNAFQCGSITSLSGSRSLRAAAVRHVELQCSTGDMYRRLR